MRYALLIYSAPEEEPTDPGPVYQAYTAFGEKWSAVDKIITGEALQPVETATTVRVRNGDAMTTDGPFAESKEHLGGFYLINVDNLDEAMAIAAEVPTAEYGSIEIRPLIEFS